MRGSCGVVLEMWRYRGQRHQIRKYVWVDLICVAKPTQGIEFTESFQKARYLSEVSKISSDGLEAWKLETELELNSTLGPEKRVEKGGQCLTFKCRPAKIWDLYFKKKNTTDFTSFYHNRRS